MKLRSNKGSEDFNFFYRPTCLFIKIFLFLFFLSGEQNNVVYAQSPMIKSDIFSGTSQLSFNYNSLPDDSRQLPPSYLLWTGNQHFGFNGLPFEFAWNFSSANSGDRLLPNALSIKFDSEKFRNDLRKRAEEQIKAESRGILQNKIKAEELKNEKSSINNFFNNSQVKEQMWLITKYDSINDILVKRKQDLPENEKQSLLAELNRLEPVYQNKAAFDELAKKNKELDSLENENLIADSIKDLPDFDYSQLENPLIVKRELVRKGKLSKTESAGLWINKFQAGRFSPFWNDNFLRGVSVDGAEISITPGNFFTGIIAGNLFPWQMLGLPSNNLPFQRNVIAAKAGFGQENSSNIKIHILQFKDQPDENDILYPPSPKANYILNLSGEAHVWENKLFIRGSVSGSQTTNTRLENSDPLLQTNQITVPAPDNPSKWIDNILYQKNNSLTFSTDKAIEGEIKINPFKNGPSLSSEFKYTGPYYQSFGSPFLPADYQIIKTGAEQSLWRNKVFLTGSISAFHDNLSHAKKYTSYWNNYLTGIRLILPASIQMLITYKTLQQTSPVNYLYHFLVAQASHIYLRNFVRSISTLNYTTQIPENNFISHNIMASNDMVFTAGHRLFTSLTAVVSGTKPLVSFQVTPQYVFFRKWSNGIGINYYSIGKLIIQKGIHYESAFKLSNKISFSLRTEYKIMSDYPQGSISLAGSQGYQWFLTSRIIAFW